MTMVAKHINHDIVSTKFICLTGIKKSAVERVKFELGLDIDDFNQLNLVDKVLYKSKSCNIWGEYERTLYFILTFNWLLK